MPILTINSASGGNSFPATGSKDYPATVPATVVYVYAMPDAGWTLDRWILDGAESVESPIAITMDMAHALTPSFKSRDSLIPFHSGNVLLDASYPNNGVPALLENLFWENNGIGTIDYAAETVVVSDGEVLPDGQIVASVEGGKCLRHMAGWDLSTPPQRMTYNFYATYVNGGGNWNFRYAALFKMRVFNNHPAGETRFLIFLSPGWEGYYFLVLPANTAPLNQWFEISVDLRKSTAPAQGSTPALARVQGFTIWNFLAIDPNTDYLLTDFWAVEAPLGPGPLDCAVTPADTFVTVGQEATFTANVQGGQPPYIVDWYDWDADPYKTRDPTTLIASNTPVLKVTPTAKGLHRYYAAATDALPQVITSNVIALNAVSRYHVLKIDSNLSEVPVTYRRL